MPVICPCHSLRHTRRYMGPFHHRAHEGDLEPDRMLREVVDEIRKAEACRDKLEVLGGEEWLKIQDQILQVRTPLARPQSTLSN